MIPSARTNKYKAVYLSALDMRSARERITPMTLARKSGFSHPSKISIALKALEIDGLIKRINHSWHDVEIEVFGK